MKLLEFKDMDGSLLAINLDLIAVVSRNTTPTTSICFSGNDLDFITVHETYDDVVAKIKAAYEL